MNSVSVFPTPNEIENSFPSLAALRVVHSNLLKQYRQDWESELPLTAQLLSDIEAFIRRGKATGALLDSEDDRWAAQSLLDYWIAILYRSGFELSEATIADFDSSLAPELDGSLCPYLGLEAFREKDRQFFYGRQRLLEQLLQKFQESRLLSVVGSSGSGKSSVVLGGLIPSLKAGKLTGSENWHYHGSMVPGSSPLANLARLFCPEDIEESVWVKQQTEQLLNNSNHLTQLLNHEDGQPSVLVIDQFEEIFTLCFDEAKRHAFIKSILAVIESPEISHRFVLTMRSDFESWVANISNFYPSFEKAKVYVTPLDAAELREAIQKPAELVGLKFEDKLVDKLIQDVVGEPAALPLLQFTLLKLWDNRERNRITWNAYMKLGGNVRRVLSKSANKFYTNLIPENQTICKGIFLKMVRPTEGLEVTSSRIPIKELYQTELDRVNTEKVLKKLIEARLVKISQGNSSKDDQVEVAHEALIRNWHKLVEWLEDERVNLRQRFRLKAAAEQWEAKGRNESVLLRGRLLQDAQQSEDLSDLEKEFIRVSKNYEHRKIIIVCSILIFSFLGFIAAIFLIVNKKTEQLRAELKEVEKQLENKKQELNTKTQELNTKTQELNTKTQELNTKTQELNTKTQELRKTQTQIDTLKKEYTRTITNHLDDKIINPLGIALGEKRTITQEEMEKIRNESIKIRVIIAEGNLLAKEYEIKGFQALVERDLKEAKDYFSKAYQAGLTYHSVDEILHQVLTDDKIKEYKNPNTSDSRKQQIIKEIYQKIVTDYSDRAPQKQLKEMKKQLGLN